MALNGLYTTTNGDTVGEGSYVQFVAYILEGHFGGANRSTVAKVSDRTSTFTWRS
jgi:hypothetical protein